MKDFNKFLEPVQFTFQPQIKVLIYTTWDDFDGVCVTIKEYRYYDILWHIKIKISILTPRTL